MMNKSVQGIITASLIFMFSEAVLSCTFTDKAAADQAYSDALVTIRMFHWPAVLLGVGVLVLFLVRRFKGIVILLFAIAALAISPGWSESSVILGAACEPNAFGVKVVLGVVAACFVGQLAFWIVELRRKNPCSSVSSVYSVVRSSCSYWNHGIHRRH